MQLIFYYVVGQRANATTVNKLIDRCKIKTGDKMSRSIPGFEPRVLSGMSSSQPPRYTTAPFSFMLQMVFIFNAFKFVWRRLQRSLIALFFFLNNRFLCTKECLTIFIYLEINWDGLQTDTNDFLRFTTVL